MKYRKIPVEIETIQWDGENLGEILELFPTMRINYSVVSNELRIKTLEGDMLASPGDWIIEGVHGEYYPCKPDIFAKTYEPA